MAATESDYAPNPDPNPQGSWQKRVQASYAAYKATAKRRKLQPAEEAPADDHTPDRPQYRQKGWRTDPDLARAHTEIAKRAKATRHMFLSPALRRRCGTHVALREQALATPMRAYAPTHLAWLVANPQYLATRILQQALPGLVTTSFGYSAGLLVFHNEYARNRAVQGHSVAVGGHQFRVDPFRVYHEVDLLLPSRRNLKNLQSPKAVLRAEVTDIAARALFAKFPDLQLVQWVSDASVANDPQGWPVICGATVKFASAEACAKAVGIGLYSIEGEYVRVRPYRRWSQRYEEVPKPGTEGAADTGG